MEVGQVIALIKSAIKGPLQSVKSEITSVAEHVDDVDNALFGYVFVDSTDEMTDYMKSYVLNSNKHIYQAQEVAGDPPNEFEIKEINYRVKESGIEAANNFIVTDKIPFDPETDGSATFTIKNASNLYDRYGAASRYDSSRIVFYNSSLESVYNTKYYLGGSSTSASDIFKLTYSNGDLSGSFSALSIPSTARYFALCWPISSSDKNSVPMANLPAITQQEAEAKNYGVYISTHSSTAYQFVDTEETYTDGENEVTNLKTRVTTIESEIPSSTNIITRNRDVEDVAKYASEYGVGYGGTENYYKQCSMLVTTDLHSCWDQFNSAIDYLNYLGTLDIGGCLGDIVVNKYTDDSTSYNSAVARSQKPFLTLVGNHDCGNSTTPSNCGTTAEVLAKFITPNEAKAGQSGLTVPYYTYTDTTHKITFICLYNYDSPETKEGGSYVWARGYACYSQTEIDWLITTLSNVPSDYAVVILEHEYTEPNTAVSCNWTQWNMAYIGSSNTNNAGYGDVQIVSEIVNAWKNGTTFSGTFAPSSSTVLPTLSISCDFTSRGAGEFICYLAGHRHRDIVAKNSKFNDQIAIVLGATAIDEWQNSDSDLPRVFGKKSEDLITVVGFDRRFKRINLVRIGSNKTFTMVDRTMFSIQYGS